MGGGNSLGQVIWLVAGWIGMIPALAAAAVPQHGTAVHLGVATCTSSACHGAVTPAAGGVVQQNEYGIWQTQDKHAGAYQLLFTEASQQMARKLGLGEAQSAAICLDCHADNVPAARRGPRFQLTDGIACEACHGGADAWIQLHKVNDDQSSHRRNVAAGLYPTDEPVARAELCLSCHMGDQTKFATHRIMGAGHPRLIFELDTFTAIEPPHFTVDTDYRARKRWVNGAQTWATGQAMATARLLELGADSGFARAGLWPELSFQDCHACHTPMSAGLWRERASVGLGPGVVHFNDANLIMLRIAASVVAPDLAGTLESQARDLHQASRGSADAFRAAARALRSTARKAADRFAGAAFGQTELRGLFAALIAAAERGEYRDFAAAEQASMALSAIATAQLSAGWIDQAQFGRLDQVITEVYAAVEDDERYRSGAFVAALRRLGEVAR